MAKRKICKIRYCENQIYKYNLCEQHFFEEEEEKRQNENALILLREGLIDNEPLSKESLRTEFFRLIKYWSDTCLTARTKTQIGCIPVDQFEATTSWCKNLAKLIIEEERAFRNGIADFSHSTGFMRKDLWERFEKKKRKSN
nr:hypothetical protein [Desulfobacula sp.]